MKLGQGNWPPKKAASTRDAVHKVLQRLTEWAWYKVSPEDPTLLERGLKELDSPLVIVAVLLGRSIYTSTLRRLTPTEYRHLVQEIAKAFAPPGLA